LAKCFHLTVWWGNQKYFAQGYPRASLVTRRGAAKKYSRQQAADLKRRFRRMKLQLKLEEVAEAEAGRASEPISDQARQLLMFD
jgi:hypothetical protein